MFGFKSDAKHIRWENTIKIYKVFPIKIMETLGGDFVLPYKVGDYVLGDFVWGDYIWGIKS